MMSPNNLMVVSPTNEEKSNLVVATTPTTDGPSSRPVSALNGGSMRGPRSMRAGSSQGHRTIEMMNIKSIRTGAWSSEAGGALNEEDEEQLKLESQISMLLTAASKNNTRRIRGLLNAGVPPSSCDYDQRTALHLACSEGHLEAAQLLIEEGADINAKDRFGSTPLDDAMHTYGHHELVAYLKARDAAHGGLGKLQNKLFDAIAKNDVAGVSQLLGKDKLGVPVPHSAGIDPNFGDYDKRTPLHLAVAEGNTEFVKLLLANGADPHAKDRWGLTPIAEAERKAARVGQDPIKQIFADGGFLEEEHASIWSFFSLFFGFWEVCMMVLFGLFVEYGPRADGAGPDPPAAGTLPIDDANSAAQAEISRVYPLYQDVHVMIFIGFGFLMVFLRKHGYSSVGLTFLIAAFAIQWYQLCHGFWHDVFSGVWSKIPLSIESLVLGDFAAGSVLITFGVLLGKVNPSQILFISIIEVACFALNERIGLQIGAADLGGTMTIHMFGAFFGYACSWMMTPKDAMGHENNAANYHSDIMAMIGTIFLWLYWPSFNGALGAGAQQERAIINTLLSLCGSCVCAFLASHVFRRERKFNMVDVQNATLAGGVAMGACCDMIILPGSAIGIGGIAGLVSVLGYVYVQPFLETRFGLHDTCGVNNLHGMPSLIGGFASVIAASFAEVQGVGRAHGYGQEQLDHIFFKRVDSGRTANDQAAVQFAYMMTSIGISLLSGAIAGNFAMTRIFAPTEPKSMYVDSEYWEVPQLETPYYFDHRGEISRATEAEEVVLAEGKKLEVEGEEGSRIGGESIDTDRLLSLIQSLEARVNSLSRRVGGAPLTPQVTSDVPQKEHKELPSSSATKFHETPQDIRMQNISPEPIEGTAKTPVAIHMPK